MLLIDYMWFVGAHITRIICDIIIVILSPLVFVYYSYTRNGLTKTKKFKSILITGGSSGIGKAVALEFVKSNPNRVIIITGRNKRRLDSAVRALKDSGSENTKIVAEIIDVTNKDAMKQFINKMDEEHTLDLVIANAGTHPSMLKNPHYFESCEKVLDVNCQGVLNTILPIIPRFQERKQGHLAVTGSLASYFSTCKESHYAATKAYIRFLCDDIRPKLKLVGNVDMSYIAPGYVRSRMVDERKAAKVMGYMTEDKAAKIIVDGLKSNHAVITFPNNLFSAVFLLGSLHPMLNVLLNDNDVRRHKAVQHVGFYHEVDPNDEFGGEC